MLNLSATEVKEALDNFDENVKTEGQVSTINNNFPKAEIKPNHNTVQLGRHRSP